MPQSVLEMTKDLVMAQIRASNMPPEDVHHALQQTFTNLLDLKMKEDQDERSDVRVAEPSPEPIDWRKSITRQSVTCLECGQMFKQLSSRHLRDHGLDGRSYRDKYGIPRTQSLAARAVTAKRRQVVQQTRPWEKAPRYRQGKGL